MYDLTITDAVRLAGVDPQTLRAWDRKGWITAKRNARGWRLFNREELLRFKEQRGVLV